MENVAAAAEMLVPTGLWMLWPSIVLSRTSVVLRLIMI